MRRVPRFLVVTRVSPRHVGAPSRLIIWRPFKHFVIPERVKWRPVLLTNEISRAIGSTTLVLVRAILPRWGEVPLP
jgi:hypothetical protein